MEIGLIGCGAWGHKILCELRKLDCRVVVFDPSERARRAAIEEGAINARSQVAGKADGWIIASPASTHASMLAQLADSESPIFVEKPFTTDLASARHALPQLRRPALVPPNVGGNVFPRGGSGRSHAKADRGDHLRQPGRR